MAEYTSNYNLKKPAQADYYDVDDFNGNADILDSTLHNLQLGTDAFAEDVEARLSAVENKAEDNTFRIENAEEEMNDLLAELKYRSCCTLIAAKNSANGIKNIADYKCSGTDDKDQINAAIAAMGENGGRIIFAPGTYNLDNSILVDKDNVTLEGIGNAEIIFKLNQFNIQGKNIKIKNLNITADTAFQSTIGTEGKQGDFITIEDCNVKVNTAVMNIIANGIHVKFINNKLGRFKG